MLYVVSIKESQLQNTLDNTLTLQPQMPQMQQTPQTGQEQTVPPNRKNRSLGKKLIEKLIGYARDYGLDEEDINEIRGLLASGKKVQNWWNSNIINASDEKLYWKY